MEKTDLARIAGCLASLSDALRNISYDISQAQKKLDALIAAQEDAADRCTGGRP